MLQAEREIESEAKVPPGCFTLSVKLMNKRVAYQIVDSLRPSNEAPSLERQQDLHQAQFEASCAISVFRTEPGGPCVFQANRELVKVTSLKISKRGLEELLESRDFYEPNFLASNKHGPYAVIGGTIIEKLLCLLRRLRPKPEHLLK